MAMLGQSKSHFDPFSYHLGQSPGVSHSLFAAEGFCRPFPLLVWRC